MKRKQRKISEPICLDVFTKATIIGLWRQGNPDAVICAVLNCKLSDVFDTIKNYKTL